MISFNLAVSWSVGTRSIQGCCLNYRGNTDIKGENMCRCRPESCTLNELLYKQAPDDTSSKD